MICARWSVKHCYWFTPEYLEREDNAWTLSTMILGSTPPLERVLQTLLTSLFVLSISGTPSWGLFFQLTGLDLCHLAGLGAFAAAARAADAIVALLRNLGATSGRQITHQAGQHQWNGCHEGPACATVRVRAGARLVSTGAFLVLISAVVEDALD